MLTLSLLKKTFYKTLISRFLENILRMNKKQFTTVTKSYNPGLIGCRRSLLKINYVSKRFMMMGTCMSASRSAYHMIKILSNTVLLENDKRNTQK